LLRNIEIDLKNSESIEGLVSEKRERQYFSLGGLFWHRLFLLAVVKGD
jgi:hypothetical protein